MAYVIHVCAFLVLFVIVNGLPLIGKGFFCRDPDTGTLHDINTTWPSKTFCGNYTCKLKRKNATSTEYVPFREFRGSNVELGQTVTNKINETVTIDSKYSHDTLKVLHNQNVTKDISDILNDNGNDDDRHLTETEITIITRILRTLKKSELDSIVEIYNLAQDIYKEMDKATSDNILDDINFINKPEHDKHKNSYWYDRNENKATDMHLEGSNLVPEVVHNSYPYYQSAVPYDVGRSDYYVPYVYKSPAYYNLANAGVPKTTYYSSPTNYWYPWLTRYVRPLSETVVESAKLLPYPFSQINRSNITQQNLQNIPYVWSSNNVYKQVYQNPLQFPYNYPTLKPQKLQAVEVKKESEVQKKTDQISEKKEDTKNLKKKKNKLDLASWQTEQLSSNILEEVKANIFANKLLKPISIRNKVKLEKVGKVIKLEDSSRRKREIESLDEAKDEELYEAYLEKTECYNDVEPGFFRKGNESESFPACCPSRINVA